MKKPRGSKLRIPADVVETFQKLLEDEHSFEKISEITGHPVHVIKRSLQEATTEPRP